MSSLSHQGTPDDSKEASTSSGVEEKGRQQASGPSEYQRRREANIAENQRILATLGLSGGGSSALLDKSPTKEGESVMTRIFAVSFINSGSYSALAGATDVSGTPPPSTTLDNITKEIALETTTDKAVKAILPFLKELSNNEWWNLLLASWISFEAKGPPKLVNLFYKLISKVLIFHIVATHNQ